MTLTLREDRTRSTSELEAISDEPARRVAMHGPKKSLRKRRELIALTILTLLLLAPFAGKAFHIDDPFYIWVAQQIGKNPLDFYGFQVNWRSVAESAAVVNQNPPLASLYLYLVSRFTGFSEVGLHFGHFLLALASVLGTYVLASRCTAQPFLAALICLSTPVFFISATTVMSEIPLLACFVWAAVFWTDGLEARSPAKLFAGGALVAGAALSKYFGVALIPLLFAYSLCREPRISRWILPLLFPVVAIAAYELYTRTLYGHGCVGAAVAFASCYQSDPLRGFLDKVPPSLVYAGGCVSTVLFLGPLVLSRKQWIAILLAFGILWAFVVSSGQLGYHNLRAGELPGMSVLQAVLFSFSGLLVYALLIRHLKKPRNEFSLLIFLWAIGTLAFGGFINWTQSGRAYLPLAPAVGILLARQLETVLTSPGMRGRLPWLLLAPAGCIALIAAWGDYELARSGREAAKIAVQKYRVAGNTLWFQGHWGFQYYMEKEGARPVDCRETKTQKGDVVIVPRNNASILGVPAERSSLVEVLEIPLKGFASTMSPKLGAGFYSNKWGGMPFVLGAPLSEQYRVYVASGELDFLSHAVRTWEVLR